MGKRESSLEGEGGRVMGTVKQFKIYTCGFNKKGDTKFRPLISTTSLGISNLPGGSYLHVNALLTVLAPPAVQVAGSRAEQSRNPWAWKRGRHPQTSSVYADRGAGLPPQKCSHLCPGRECEGLCCSHHQELKVGALANTSNLPELPRCEHVAAASKD